MGQKTSCREFFLARLPILIGCTSFFVFLTSIAGTLGCVTHSTASYAVLSSVLVCSGGITTLCLIPDKSEGKRFGRLCILYFALISSLFAGFLGYTFDNYCVYARDEKIENATVWDAALSGQKFEFTSSTLLLPDIYGKYDDGSYVYLASVIADCLPDATPATCLHVGNDSLKGYTGIAAVTKLVFGDIPTWNNDVRQAVKIKLLGESGYINAIGQLSSSHKVNLLTTDMFTWGDIDAGEKQSRSAVIATVCTGIAAAILPWVALLVEWKLGSYCKFALSSPCHTSP